MWTRREPRHKSRQEGVFRDQAPENGSSQAEIRKILVECANDNPKYY